ncbi:MAG TPA: STAS domain-containing protein [Spirochaetota bacterium]|nr:STAS domain-containing protein [Spirochaetota bacterium]HOL56748.1 STAS domain-containing protein [Spirochaetota bacterium]HPP04180.1 STAS domain-containing protein [Spirochaetota bacterium]
MNIKYYYNEDTADIYVEGIIDASSSSELNTKFQEIMSNPSIKNVNLDLKNVESINSSGIGKILRFYKYIDGIGGEFKIVHVSDRLFEVFRDINLDKIISISK